MSCQASPGLPQTLADGLPSSSAATSGLCAPGLGLDGIHRFSPPPVTTPLGGHVGGSMLGNARHGALTTHDANARLEGLKVRRVVGCQLVCWAPPAHAPSACAQCTRRVVVTPPRVVGQACLDVPGALNLLSAMKSAGVQLDEVRQECWGAPRLQLVTLAVAISQHLAPPLPTMPAGLLHSPD